jgi:hypothetical protein
MTKLVDLTGRVYGRLTVLRRDGKLYGKAAWECSCTCGEVLQVCGNDLKSGNKASCGCLKRDVTKLKNYSHGLTETAEYKTWCKMKSRCNVESDISFPNYGGRGIMVCPQWERSFETFFADMGPKPEGDYSIERMNSDGDYEPGNCKWATRKEQNRNKRNTHYVEYEGKSIAIVDLAEKFNIPYGRLYKRLTRFNWTVERAVA